MVIDFFYMAEPWIIAIHSEAIEDIFSGCVFVSLEIGKHGIGIKRRAILKLNPFF